MPSMSEFERLFLLEFFVDSVYIKNSSVEDVNESSLCVSFQFLNYPVMLVCEEDFGPKTKSLTKGTSVIFKSGKSCLFSLRTDQSNSMPSEFDVNVTVTQNINRSSAPEKAFVAEAMVRLGSSFTDLMKNASALPTAYVKQDSFPLKDKTDQQVGNLAAFVRLSCFGKLIVTQFQLAGEDSKNYMFKGTDPKKIFTNEQDVVKTVPSFGVKEDEEGEEEIPGDTPYKDIFGFPKESEESMKEKDEIEEEGGGGGDQEAVEAKKKVEEREAKDEQVKEELDKGEGEENYKEIGAEINGNSICIRVLKKGKKVKKHSSKSVDEISQVPPSSVHPEYSPLTTCPCQCMSVSQPQPPRTCPQGCPPSCCPPPFPPACCPPQSCPPNCCTSPSTCPPTCPPNCCPPPGCPPDCCPPPSTCPPSCPPDCCPPPGCPPTCCPPPSCPPKCCPLPSCPPTCCPPPSCPPACCPPPSCPPTCCPPPSCPPCCPPPPGYCQCPQAGNLPSFNPFPGGLQLLGSQIPGMNLPQCPKEDCPLGLYNLNTNPQQNPTELEPGMIAMKGDQVVFQMANRQPGEPISEKEKKLANSIYYKLATNEQGKEGVKNVVQISAQNPGEPFAGTCAGGGPVSGLPIDNKQDMFLLKVQQNNDGVDAKSKLEMELRTPKTTLPKPETGTKNTQCLTTDFPAPEKKPAADKAKKKKK